MKCELSTCLRQATVELSNLNMTYRRCRAHARELVEIWLRSDDPLKLSLKMLPGLIQRNHREGEERDQLGHFVVKAAPDAS